MALILDDLHWADPASCELLAYLIRRPAKELLLVCAYRDRQAGHRLLGALAEAGPAAIPHVHLRMGPLSLGEARELVGDRPELRELHDESGGNPLYLKGLAGGAAGSTLTGLLAGELARLSDMELRAAQAGAVLGDAFTPDDVAMLGPIPAVLGELAARDLIRDTGDGRFRFRHPSCASSCTRAPTPPGACWPTGWPRGSCRPWARRSARWRTTCRVPPAGTNPATCRR